MLRGGVDASIIGGVAKPTLGSFGWHIPIRLCGKVIRVGRRIDCLVVAEACYSIYLTVTMTKQFVAPSKSRRVWLEVLHRIGLDF